MGHLIDLNELADQVVAEFRMKVEQYKLDNNLSFAALSEECDVCYRTMIDFVNGKNANHDGRTLIKISLALGIPLI